MSVLGDDKRVEYEARTVAALCRLFASDRYASTAINSDEPDATGRCLSDPFASDLSIGIAWAELKRIQPHQADVLRKLYGQYLSRRTIAEQLHRDRNTVAIQEADGLTQLIRWVFDEPTYELKYRVRIGTRTKDTTEYRDWLRYRETEGFKLWARRRKRAMAY